MKKTVRIYGEYAGRVADKIDRSALLQSWKKGDDHSRRWNTVAPIAPLNAMLAATIPRTQRRYRM